MSVLSTVSTIGEFLLEHGDIVEDVAKALADGTPKEAIRAAIRGAQVEVSDDAIRDELAAATRRRERGLP